MTRAELTRRLDDLMAEIRNYPTPIARCDLHLPAMLEERSHLLQKLDSFSDTPSCSPDAVWANDGGH